MHNEKCMASSIHSFNLPTRPTRMVCWGIRSSFFLHASKKSKQKFCLKNLVQCYPNFYSKLSTMNPYAMPVPPKRCFRRACVTIFDFNQEHPEIFVGDAEAVRYAVWSLEKSPKTNKLHLQMYVECATDHKLGTWKETVLCCPSAHVEMAKGTRQQCRDYCCKEETHVAGPWSVGEFEKGGQGKRNDIHESLRVTLSRIDEIGEDAFRAENMAAYLTHRAAIHMAAQYKLADKARAKKRAWFDAHPLYFWQQKVVDLVDKQLADENDRSIIWVWDEPGNVGKSKLLTYLRLYKGAVNLGGKVDAAKMVYRGEPVACFDLSRTQQEFAGGMYSLSEELKNGEFLSSKYMSFFKDFESPIVVFFANFYPPDGKWSGDRVHIVHAGRSEHAERDNTL